jgi:phosphatidylethanolamine/phosphatidyl-N-methylethanolamine N-methyltransferase
MTEENRPKGSTPPNLEASQAARRRYDRIAPIYDLMEMFSRRHMERWMDALWPLVEGPRFLEVGVGTGKNLSSYPAGLQAAAIDLSPGMLERARRKAVQSKSPAELLLMDAQALAFPEDTFDTVLATCVFCSVPDPVLGLREVMRTVKQGGKVLLVEHVRSEKALLGLLMDLVNPLVARVVGPNINRRTVENVRKANLHIERIENLGMGDIFKLIVARKS